MKFHNIPIWMLDLYPLKIKKNYIPDFRSFSDILQHIRHLGFDAQIFNKSVTLIGQRQFIFGVHPHQSSVWLVSGTFDYLNDQINTLQKD